MRPGFDVWGSLAETNNSKSEIRGPSTAQRTMRLSAASVGMTEFVGGCGRERATAKTAADPSLRSRMTMFLGDE
jgi:hypothetical protein